LEALWALRKKSFQLNDHLRHGAPQQRVALRLPGKEDSLQRLHRRSPSTDLAILTAISGLLSDRSRQIHPTRWELRKTRSRALATKRRNTTDIAVIC
jgi:hypothetical protein